MWAVARQARRARVGVAPGAYRLSRVEFELWTDGACSGNPGPGGWAAILVARRADGTIAKQVELSGGEPLTTNNRMELRAVIEGLRALQRTSAVTVHIDSSYVMDAITKRWYAGWKARGWTTSSKQPVKNRELWEALLVALEGHTVTWKKVKGHAGIALNERCDQLAVAACRAVR
jgi:ribonuclease HI